MTGRLEDVFLHLFSHLEFEREMGERIRTAMRYPSLVVMAMLAAVVVINIFVIPAFANVYAGLHAQLPLQTRLLITTSSFALHYSPLLLAATIGVVFAFQAYLGTVNGLYKWDKLKLHFRIVGKIILKATLARFARSFSLSNKSGIPIALALSVIAQRAGNTYVASHIEQMRNGVERGESVLRTATISGVFTPVVLQMIAVGEENSEPDDLMDEIAKMYEHEVDYQLRTLSSEIEPVLIVVLGMIVLVMALGIFLPMFDIGNVAMKH